MKVSSWRALVLASRKEDSSKDRVPKTTHRMKIVSHDFPVVWNIYFTKGGMEMREDVIE